MNAPPASTSVRVVGFAREGVLLEVVRSPCCRIDQRTNRKVTNTKTGSSTAPDHSR